MLVLLVPGMAHSLAASRASSFSFSPGASGPVTRSLTAPYLNNAILSRIVSSMTNSWKAHGVHPRGAPRATHGGAPG